MKDKIKLALKTKFGNLGFGEKAFQGVADYLSTTVTEETQIETAIGGVEPLLKAFQGDIDTRVTSALAKQKAELEKKPVEPPTPTPSPQPTDIAAIVADAVKKAVEPLAMKVEGFEKDRIKNGLVSRIKDTLYKDKTQKEKFILDMMFEKGVNIETEDKLGETITAMTEEFNTKYQAAVKNGVIADVPASSTPGSTETDFVKMMHDINKVEEKK